MATKLTSTEAFELIKVEYIKQCWQQYGEYKDSDPELAGHYTTNITAVNSVDEGDLAKLLNTIRHDGNYDEDDENYYDLIIRALLDTAS